MYQRTFLGAKTAEPVADLSSTEALAVAPLLILMVWMGVASNTFLPPQNAVNQKILEQTKMNVEFRVATPTPEATYGN
jgi:NADH:ubiquinone oxidoreductase subunit 4 (subunit M)